MRTIPVYRMTRLLLAALVGFGPAYTAAESVTVVSWGGSYADACEEAYLKPVAAETGVEVSSRMTTTAASRRYALKWKRAAFTGTLSISSSPTWSGVATKDFSRDSTPRCWRTASRPRRFTPYSRKHCRRPKG